MDEETRRAFDDAARARDPGLLVEVVAFLRENRSWWLVPILAVLLLFGLVLALASSSAAPLLYTLF